MTPKNMACMIGPVTPSPSQMSARALRATESTGYAEQFNAADTSFTVLRKPFRLIELNRAISKATVKAGGMTAPNVIKLHANRRAEGAAVG